MQYTARRLLLLSAPAFCWPAALGTSICYCFAQAGRVVSVGGTQVMFDCAGPPGFRSIYVAAECLGLLGVFLATLALKDVKTVESRLVRAVVYAAVGASVLLVAYLGLRGGRLWL